ncbi:hypothetical protein HK099_000065 [Clydaea vesicula]|uniref:Histone H1 n=1 Tax=Clydaea vesicula TaxID=447962 RepID=A0AAD5XZF6_9FUNG|nr:hypothetical protein HK099_000065 [Clydaea vesicula]
MISNFATKSANELLGIKRQESGENRHKRLNSVLNITTKDATSNNNENHEEDIIRKPGRIEAVNNIKAIENFDMNTVSETARLNVLKMISDTKSKEDLKFEPTLTVDSSVEDFRAAQDAFTHPGMILNVLTDTNNKNVINEFDDLCNEILGCLGELETSLEEMTLWKDDFLRQSAPSNVKLQMTMMFAKLFRSKSDFHEPLFELVKQVRMYSRPWINKKLSLLELETDYIRQKHILDVAIRKLEHLHLQLNRLKSDTRSSLWERLARRLILKACDKTKEKTSANFKSDSFQENGSALDKENPAYNEAAPTMEREPSFSFNNKYSILKTKGDSSQNFNVNSSKNLKENINEYIATETPSWKKDQKETVKKFARLLRKQHPEVIKNLKLIHDKQFKYSNFDSTKYLSQEKGSYIESKNPDKKLRKSWSLIDLKTVEKLEEEVRSKYPKDSNFEKSYIAKQSAGTERIFENAILNQNTEKGEGEVIAYPEKPNKTLLRCNSYNAIHVWKNPKLTIPFDSRKNQKKPSKSARKGSNIYVQSDALNAQLSDASSSYSSSSSDDSSDSDSRDYENYLTEKDQVSLHNTIAKFFGADNLKWNEEEISDDLNTKKHAKATHFSMQDVMEITLLHAQQMQMMSTLYEEKMSEMESNFKDLEEEKNFLIEDYNSQLRMANERAKRMAEEMANLATQEEDRVQVSLSLPSTNQNHSATSSASANTFEAKQLTALEAITRELEEHHKKYKKNGKKSKRRMKNSVPVFKTRQIIQKHEKVRKKPVFFGEQFTLNFLERLQWFTKTKLNNHSELSKKITEMEVSSNEKRLLQTGYISENATSKNANSNELSAEFMPPPGKIPSAAKDSWFENSKLLPIKGFTNLIILGVLPWVAIVELADKHGSSRQAIKRYILSSFAQNPEANHYFKNALKKGVTDGVITQSAQTFKLAQNETNHSYRSTSRVAKLKQLAEQKDTRRRNPAIRTTITRQKTVVSKSKISPSKVGKSKGTTKQPGASSDKTKVKDSAAAVSKGTRSSSRR